MGRFNFFVHGYNDHPDELYAIPEVRKFYQRFREIWPYWFYFCDLRSDALLMMTLCSIDRLSGTRRDGTPSPTSPSTGWTCSGSSPPDLVAS